MAIVVNYTERLFDMTSTILGTDIGTEKFAPKSIKIRILTVRSVVLL